MRRVIQLIPGNGWKGVYAMRSVDGKPRLWRAPLVCFGLVEHVDELPGITDEYWSIDGFRQATGYKGELVKAEGVSIAGCAASGDDISPVSAGNFLGYESPEDNDDEGWNELWYDWDSQEKNRVADLEGHDEDGGAPIYVSSN